MEIDYMARKHPIRLNIYIYNILCYSVWLIDVMKKVYVYFL